MRAPAASAIAVACGTPMPSTPRLVHAWPGPTPTSTPTAPVRMRCNAVEYDAHPPTITGISYSRMNFFKLSGWRESSFDTCSADTTVPCTTSRSSSASRIVLRVVLDALRRERRARSDAGVADLRDAAADQLVLDRLGVDLLHAARRLLGLERGDLLEVRLRVLVARPETFEVETREAAEPADLDRGAGRDHAVHRRRDERAAGSGTRRSPRRCRCPRGPGSGGSGRSRCRRTRRPGDRTCRSRSRLPPGDSSWGKGSGYPCRTGPGVPTLPAPAPSAATDSGPRQGRR